MAGAVLRLVSAPGKWSCSGLCWRCYFGHAWWWAFSEICRLYVVENYLDAGCDFPPILWAESPDLHPATTNGCESYHGHLNAEFSAQLNQTFTCSLRRYCDNRHPRTFLWRHFHSHGQFAWTAERSPHFCDARTLITARDFCPKRSTSSVYHTDFILLECFTEDVMT